MTAPSGDEGGREAKKFSPAVSNLKSNQRQLDMDGCGVGVSRQALDEALSEYAELLGALKTARDEIRSDWCDTEEEFKQKYAVKIIDAAIARAESSHAV